MSHPSDKETAAQRAVFYVITIALHSLDHSGAEMPVSGLQSWASGLDRFLAAVTKHPTKARDERFTWTLLEGTGMAWRSVIPLVTLRLHREVNACPSSFVIQSRTPALGRVLSSCWVGLLASVYLSWTPLQQHTPRLVSFDRID